jgi:hypothetical protein
MRRVQAPRFNEIEQILLVESHKLDPPPLDEGPRLKNGKLRLNLHRILSTENQLVHTPKKIGAQRRAHDLENKRCKLGSTRHGSTQQFNLLQMSPNWFLGI